MTGGTSPIRATDDSARAMAAGLLAAARHGALGVIHPETGWPHVTRIALAMIDGVPVTLVSDLALHTRALRADPRAGLLIGEPGPRGDPLVHPRISLTVRAGFVPRPSAADEAIRAAWLAGRPKSTVYAGLADFHFLRLEILGAALNAGFGRAYILTPSDLSVARGEGHG
ncbi:MAG: pyridoxamine 5'-phosphate oxidase family protein [Rhodobacteraceae bacterium]|nr:pyridoxamine 5'-phosphate oxidase family protein [Paracoccaceae bacterium]